jgi:hypothetical protein
MAAFALAQNPAPATSQTQHEERHTRSTESTTTTKTNSPRDFNGRLVDANCAALSSRWSPSGTVSADRSSSSSTTSERRETTTSSQDTSREGAPPTDRTETSRREDSASSSSSSADRSSQPMMTSSDLESCAVKSSTSSYALAMPNGQVYKLSGSTLGDDISNNKKWSKRISENDTKNMKVKVRGNLDGDTIAVETIK